MIEFFVSSGCRLDEVHGISIDQINFREKSVVVHGKGSKDRTVFFSTRAKVMLEAYLESRKGGDALFCCGRRPYNPLTARSIQKMMQTIGERVGMKQRLFPHLLRHTFASRALAAGMDITVIQKLLGHEDVSTTQIYAKVSQENIRYEYLKFVG